MGLTATPKTDVDRNTYDFFEMEHGVPTYNYDYETAVEQDHVLVPYYNYEVSTKFLEEGIVYDDLSDEDKQRYEEDFSEDGPAPDFIPPAKLNEFVFNEITVDTVLQDLMDRGIRVEGGTVLERRSSLPKTNATPSLSLSGSTSCIPNIRVCLPSGFDGYLS